LQLIRLRVTPPFFPPGSLAFCNGKDITSPDLLESPPWLDTLTSSLPSSLPSTAIRQAVGRMLGPGSLSSLRDSLNLSFLTNNSDILAHVHSNIAN